MSHEFKIGKCDDCGLVVKHGNKDNVVLFFDELKDGAIYRAVLYRTDVDYMNESFIEKAEITNSSFVLEIQEWVQDANYGSRREVKHHTFESKELTKKSFSTYLEDCLMVQSWETKDCLRYRKSNSSNYIASGNSTTCKIGRIDKVPFSKVKYITSIESSRNDLYINIDFLPCGQYFVILEVEDRNGKIIKETTPYYFKVALSSNKEVLDAIKNAGRVAGRY